MHYFFLFDIQKYFYTNFPFLVHVNLIQFWACLIGYGTEQHNAVTIFVIFFLSLFYILYHQLTSKHSHFLYHINNFLLLFK